MGYEQIRTDGFLFTRTATAFPIARAGFGDGYDQARTLGQPRRRWSVKIDVVPDLAGTPQVAAKSRAAYLWDFFVARKAAGDEAFWLKDPKDGLLYLASFADESLSFEILRSKVYATGLELRERRVRDQLTPVIDVNRIPLGAAAIKALGGTSWTMLTGVSLDPGETIIGGIAGINAQNYAFQMYFAGHAGPCDAFPDGTSPRTNIFRYKNQTSSRITGDVVWTIWDGIHAFDFAYAAFVSKFSALSDSPFDAKSNAAGNNTTPDSGNTGTLSKTDELIIGCTGVAAPGSDPAPTIAAGSEASNLGQRAGTTGASGNCSIVESFGVVNSAAPVNAGLILPAAVSWQATVVTYVIES